MAQEFTLLQFRLQKMFIYYQRKRNLKYKEKNCIRDARTPQPGRIVFNTMRYRSSETVHRLGYFQSSVSVQIMFK